MKATRTWIVIADGSRAHVLLSEGIAHPLTIVPNFSFKADLPMTHDIGSSRPGRTHESQGTTRHAYEPRSDAHTVLKETFVNSVIVAIATARKAGAFDRLLIIAPPTVLGTMRANLPDALRAVLMGDVAKDLTTTPNHEIRAHLPDDFRV
jgi:protein required for attachment to host cells